jgi:phosphatidylinositol alpha-mannosyltransferase
VLTTHRHRSEITDEEGVRVVRSWRPRSPRLLDRYEYFIETVPGTLRRIAGGRFDVLHAFSLADAWASTLARGLRGTPVIFSVQGMPTAGSLASRRLRPAMLRFARKRLAECTVLSRAAADALEREVGIRPRVIPAGVMADELAGPRTPADQPTLLCAASPGDPRKRVGLLLSAFERLRERRGDARLLVFRGQDPVLGRTPPSLPEGASWLELDPDPSLGRLARDYASAWATVLPAVDEALGLVVIESLAAGTPVVVSDSGGASEVVNDEAIGRVFRADDEGDLVRALDEVLELALQPTTVEACRARAREYDWRMLIPLYEGVYRHVMHSPTAQSTP